MNTSLPVKEMEKRLRAVMPTLPILVGNEVLDFARDRFRFSNWRGNSIVPWKKRAAKAKNNKSRAILIQSGRLRRSLRVTQRTSQMVAVGTNIIYAQVHNEGGTIKQPARSETFKRNRKLKGINKGKFKKGTTLGQGFTFKEKTIKMPKRQFLPTSSSTSPWLTKKLTALITNTILKALK